MQQRPNNHRKFQMMMRNYDESVEINDNQYLFISIHPYGILVIADSKSGKTKVLLSLIKHKLQGVHKIYMYVKNSFKSNYQLLINGREKLGTKELKNLKAFSDYSQTIDGAYEILINYNPKKEKKVLIVFEDMIKDMEDNKKVSPMVTKWFFRGRNSTFHFLLYHKLISKCLKI